jgi:predicted  nucleic acid-binding Zn-ribbon protein
MASATDSSAADKTTLNDIKQNMKETANAVANYSSAQRKDAIKNIKASLKKIDTEISQMERKLKDKTQKMDQVSRDKSQAALNTLRTQREQVARWYSNMENSTDAGWQDVKTGFLKSYQTLEGAFSKAAANF